MRKHLLLKASFFIALAAWYGLSLAKPIDLTTADIGRHLKNGELALHFIRHHEWNSFHSLLKTNFYSYTYPDYPTVNHHWGSGIIFYLAQKFWGFKGLSFFYLGLNIAAFLFLFQIAEKEAGLRTAVLITILLMPLLADRHEIRPEGFSCFFSAVFFWMLWQFRNRRLPAKALFILPVLEWLWANTHIYFFLGPFLLALFLLDENLEKKPEAQNRKKILLTIFFLTGLVTFLTPNGGEGVLYPFLIFKNYGYRVLENQSITFLEGLGFLLLPNILFFKIVLGLLVLSFIFRWSFSHFSVGVGLKPAPPYLLIFAVLLSFMAWTAIRNFTFFGLFALPIIAINLSPPIPQFLSSKKIFLIALTGVALLFLFLNHQSGMPKLNPEIGLKNGNDGSGAFFLENNIRGPIFNNYDIGGYLIWRLYPNQHVFVDNRPEAYPAAFFQNQYVPAQENEDKWKALNATRQFNAIFFGHKDATPWGQAFLIHRYQDPDWAPVFADADAILFVKRNNLNADLIARYEIPKDRFRVVSLKS